MGSVRWRKVARDFGAYPARTMLVIASIAIGVFAVGTIAGANALLDASLQNAYATSRAANATLYTATGFDRDLVESVRRMPGVADAQGRRTVVVRLDSGANSTADRDEGMRDLQLTALPDFADQRIDVVRQQSGAFPPKRGEIVLERSSLRLVDIREGDVITIRTTGGDEHRLRVAGFAYEPGASPAFYFGRLNGYVTFDTLADLGWADSFDELRVRATATSGDRGAIQRLADDVRLRIERAGTPVTFSLVPMPGRHPAHELVQALFLVLGAIGFLSLFVAGFLIVNTISVLMAQQTRQIGLMKVIGARERQIAGLYLGLVLAYAVVALAIAVPLAALASLALTTVAAGLLNFDVSQAIVPPWVVGLELAAGVGVPVVAALVPIRRGVRVTVHAAITDVGMGVGYGRGWIDRALLRLRGFSRPMLLAIRSTFRRKGRLFLTLAALTLGGAVFMTILTVRGSLFATLGDTVRYFDYDVQVELSEPVRAATVTGEALRVPGVVAAEPWRFASTLRIRPDGSQSASLVTFGLPDDAQTVNPIVQQGRWLLPGEGNALVVTANLLRDEPDLRVGDSVTLRVVGHDSTWIVVGIVQSPTMAPFLYVNSQALERIAGDPGRAGIVMVGTQVHTAAAQAEAARALREHLEAAGISVAATTTTTDVMGTIFTVFDTLVAFVSVMAILLGVVGGLGLAGTMTMNVVERAREIGVMRAIGATDGAVRLIFLGEGLLIGLLAWGAGAIVALPLSKILSDMLGEVFVQRPLAFSPSLAGLGLWLAIVLVLSTLGSIAPAWGASRIAVREVLGYE